MGVINGVPTPPFFNDYMSIATPFGVLTSPASRVAAYVFSGGPWDGAPAEIRNATVTTLASALSRCRAGYGDIIYVLPGHTENVVDATMLTNLVAGTRIIGMGEAGNRPLFTWNAVGSQWSVGAANCTFENLRMNFGGANGVTLPLTFTAAGTTIRGCEIDVGTTAILYCITAILIPTAGSRTRLINNIIHGTVLAALTTCISITGTPDNVEIRANEIIVAATTGQVLLTAAALITQLKVTDNLFYNLTAAADFCVTIGAAAITGFYARNCHFSNNAGAVVAQGIVVGAGSTLGLHQSMGSCVLTTQTALQPAADA